MSHKTNQTNQPPPVYATILGANQGVTGVRGADGANVVLTGGAHGGDALTGFIYLGPLSPMDPAGLQVMAPVFPGQTVTTSNYYGPDTWTFNPALGKGNVRVVGSYQYSGSSDRNHGVIYQGPPGGGGTWTQIDVPSGAVDGKSVANTIPHSTMGDLVVGNYDLQGVPLSANAFIYDVVKKTWVTFNFEGEFSLTTAYGIWQNGIGSPSYTIVGGTRDGAGINQGFVVNYDSTTGAFTNRKLYSALNQPGIVTHFEGITGVPGGFHLAGQASSAGGAALFATITVKPDGSFSEAVWTLCQYPGSAISTGDSVYQNVLMGIYAGPGMPGVQSYIATIPS